MQDSLRPARPGRPMFLPSRARAAPADFRQNVDIPAPIRVASRRETPVLCRPAEMQVRRKRGGVVELLLFLLCVASCAGLLWTLRRSMSHADATETNAATDWYPGYTESVKTLRQPCSDRVGCWFLSGYFLCPALMVATALLIGAPPPGQYPDWDGVSMPARLMGFLFCALLGLHCGTRDASDGVAAGGSRMRHPLAATGRFRQYLCVLARHRGLSLNGPDGDRGADRGRDDRLSSRPRLRVAFQRAATARERGRSAALFPVGGATIVA